MGVTAAVIGIGVALAGGALSAKGQHDQAAAESKAARQNAYYARLAAADALRRGDQEAGQIRSQATRMIGEQKVAFGASGVDPGSGSPLQLMADTRMMGELDAQTTRNNAAREAWGLEKQSAQMVEQARAAKKAGNWAVAGSLLGGVGNAAGMAYRWGV